MPASVPAAYATEANVRDISSSVVIGSKNTETPAVCPGSVMNEPNAPVARIIHP